jgi:uncharacterized damage-inducible protein DinB
LDLLDHSRRQFTYNIWANAEVLDGIDKSKPGLPGRPLQLLAHILSAERLWLERITHQPQSLAVWPELSIAQCEAQIEELTRLWKSYLSGASLSRFFETIAYTNSRGESWSNTVQEILTHVLFHSAYHRGQIANEMRACGATPAHTDFIHAARHGLIE